MHLFEHVYQAPSALQISPNAILDCAFCQASAVMVYLNAQTSVMREAVQQTVCRILSFSSNYLQWVVL